MKLIKRIISAAIAAAVGVCMASCGEEGSSSSIAEGSKTGRFVIALYPEYAPISCENFEKLVKDGFYDGTTFHRVVEGFMAQGGSPTDPNNIPATIKGEFAENGVDNKLSHTRGIVSMARGRTPDSASSGFFVCFDDSKSNVLDGRYAAFGEVVEGMEVIDDFLNCERVQNNMGEIATPVLPITIKKAVMLDTKDGEPHKAEFTVTYTPKEK